MENWSKIRARRVGQGGDACTTEMEGEETARGRGKSKERKQRLEVGSGLLLGGVGVDGELEERREVSDARGGRIRNDASWDRSCTHHLDDGRRLLEIGRDDDLKERRR